VFGARVCCAKTAEPIEMPFGGLTHVDPKNRVFDEVKDRTNPFAAARGDKTSTQPFAKLLWELFFFIIAYSY